MSNIDFSQNPELQILILGHNDHLIELDLRHNTNLTVLLCGGNEQLKHLDLRNGNNENMTVNATYNKPGMCIFVDDKEVVEGNNAW